MQAVPNQALWRIYGGSVSMEGQDPVTIDSQVSQVRLSNTPGGFGGGGRSATEGGGRLTWMKGGLKSMEGVRVSMFDAFGAAEGPPGGPGQKGGGGVLTFFWGGCHGVRRRGDSSV